MLIGTCGIESWAFGICFQQFSQGGKFIVSMNCGDPETSASVEGDDLLGCFMHGSKLAIGKMGGACEVYLPAQGQQECNARHKEDVHC